MGIMASEVTIAGHKFRTWEVWAVAIGGTVAVWYVYKAHEASSSASSTTSGSTDTGTDPVTGLPYSEDSETDPITGLTYLQEAEEYGSVAAAEEAVESQDSSDDYYGSDGSTLEEIPYSDVSGSETGTNYTSNSQWSQAVTVGLSDLGYSATDISAALGLYFSDQPLNTLTDGTSSYNIILAALAEYGDPPVGSYQVIAPSTTGTASTGNTSASTGNTSASSGTASTGTASTGTTSSTGQHYAAPSGHSDTPYATSVDLGWSAVSGASDYHYQIGTSSGSNNVADATTTATHASVNGLKSKTKYYWRVSADPNGSWTGWIAFTTT